MEDYRGDERKKAASTQSLTHCLQYILYTTKLNHRILKLNSNLVIRTTMLENNSIPRYKIHIRDSK